MRSSCGSRPRRCTPTAPSRRAAGAVLAAAGSPPASRPQRIGNHAMKNPADRWGPVSQWLHWTIALLLVAIATIGVLMVEMPNTPRKIEIYALHKSLGLTILALAALRLAWRLYAGRPGAVANTPRWQPRIATLTHGALYLLLL